MFCFLMTQMLTAVFRERAESERLSVITANV